MRAVLLMVLAVASGCRGRCAAPAPRSDDAPNPDAAALAGPAIDGGSLARALTEQAEGPVVLIEESDGLVARTADGAVVRTLVAGRVSHAEYTGRGVIWFVRGGRLEALDLAAPPGPPIAIVEEMPDLGFLIDGTSCDACVLVLTEPLGVKVIAEALASGGQLDGEAWRRFERDRAIALAARPRVADTAAAFVVTLRGRHSARSPDLELVAKTWPLPTSARSKNDCPDCYGTRAVECADCGRGFVLDALGWVLLVSDRKCSCSEARCWATCVLYDPARGQYAAPSAPATWRTDIAPERTCHPVFDRAGTAYILDEQHVCTQHGCSRMSGRILGWFEPGPSTASLDDDSGAWPRCDAP